MSAPLFRTLPQLNPDINVFQRKFVNEVRRCEEMDRKLSKWFNIFAFQLKKKVKGTFVMYCSWWTGFVEKEIKKANIATVDTGENPEVPFPRDMIDLEVACKIFVFWHHNSFSQYLSQVVVNSSSTCLHTTTEGCTVLSKIPTALGLLYSFLSVSEKNHIVILYFYLTSTVKYVYMK